MCDEIINATDMTHVKNTTPGNMTNTISTNFISTVSINSDKKVRYNMNRYTLHTFLIVIIPHLQLLLFVIIIHD